MNESTRIIIKNANVAANRKAKKFIGKVKTKLHIW